MSLSIKSSHKYRYMSQKLTRMKNSWLSRKFALEFAIFISTQLAFDIIFFTLLSISITLIKRLKLFNTLNNIAIKVLIGVTAISFAFLAFAILLLASMFFSYYSYVSYAEEDEKNKIDTKVFICFLAIVTQVLSIPILLSTIIIILLKKIKNIDIRLSLKPIFCMVLLGVAMIILFYITLLCAISTIYHCIVQYYNSVNKIQTEKKQENDASDAQNNKLHNTDKLDNSDVYLQEGHFECGHNLQERNLAIDNDDMGLDSDTATVMMHDVSKIIVSGADVECTYNATTNYHVAPKIIVSGADVECTYNATTNYNVVL